MTSMSPVMSVSTVRSRTRAEPEPHGAVVPGQAAEDDPDRDGEPDRDEADREGDEGALEHAREDVPPELVGAEEVDAEPRRGSPPAPTPRFGRAKGPWSRSGRRTSRGSRTGCAPFVSGDPDERRSGRSRGRPPSPSTAGRFRRKARQTSRPGDSPRAAGHGRLTAGSADRPACRGGPRGGCPTTREERRDEVERDHHRIVARQDRLVAEPADARPREDRLEDHAAADQPRDQEPQHRDEGEEPVPERVAVEHGVLGQPLGPRGPDVVRADAPRASASARTGRARRCPAVAPRSEGRTRCQVRSMTRGQPRRGSRPKVWMPITSTWKVRTTKMIARYER